MSINLMRSIPPVTNSTNTTDIYTDLSHLKDLKQTAIKDSQAALPEAARQFEALMITMMMKSLRQDGMDDPLFSSQAEDSFRDMYDQQLGLELSKGQGIGFAESIIRQMRLQDSQSGAVSNKTGDISESSQTPGQSVFKNPSFIADPISNQTAVNERLSMNKAAVEVFKIDNSATDSGEINISKVADNFSGQFDSPEDFVEKLWPMAEKAAEKLGVTADIIVSQAALETGWGKHIIRTGEKSSFNVFNIKANREWDGQRMEKSSIEFIQGKTMQQKSDFRAYASLEHSFNDYVSFLKQSPRYQSIFNSEHSNEINKEQLLHDVSYQSKSIYIEKLQKAGYATDPAYAEKVLNVLKSDVIQAQVQNQTESTSKWR